MFWYLGSLDLDLSDACDQLGLRHGRELRGGLVPALDFDKVVASLFAAFRFRKHTELLGKRDGQPVVGGRSSHNLVFNIRVEKSVIRTFILCFHGETIEDVFGDELRPFHTSVEFSAG